MRRKVLIIKIVLVVLMLLFIWGNSMFNGDASNAEASFVLQLLEPILRPILPIVQRVLAHFGIIANELAALRKLAHFSEYAILGALISILVMRRSGLPRCIVSELLCALVAVIDEYIQTFSAGRTPSPRDVLIDVSGATLGVLFLTILLLCIWAVRRRRQTN